MRDLPSPKIRDRRMDGTHGMSERERITLDMLHNGEHATDEELTQMLTELGYSAEIARKLTANRAEFEGRPTPHAVALPMLRALTGENK